MTSRKPKVGGRREGAGRPSKPRAEKRGKNVTVWLTESAYEAAVAAAQLEGLALSDWGRAAFELAANRWSSR